MNLKGNKVQSQEVGQSCTAARALIISGTFAQRSLHPVPKDGCRVGQIGSTCWRSLRDWMKAWLRVSRWACDCCRCAMASSNVPPAGSVLSRSPLPSPLFLLFSQSWRRALVALFITSDLAWVLSWKPHREGQREGGWEGGG